MNYELAKKLKDAGFPYKGLVQFYELYSYMARNGEMVYVPTLSELIEACGDVTVVFWGCKAHGYFAKSQPCLQQFHEIDSCVAEAEGKTPEESVARLWFSLNSKTL